jgi:hypothetical protein
VQNACCVLCFMTAAYEGSENCALELQFARQSGVPIVPALMQARLIPPLNTPHRTPY